MRAFLILMTCSVIALASCGEGKQPPPPKLFEEQRNAMDKAQGIEDTLQQQADQQLQDIDRQSQ